MPYVWVSSEAFLNKKRAPGAERGNYLALNVSFGPLGGFLTSL